MSPGLLCALIAAVYALLAVAAIQVARARGIPLAKAVAAVATAATYGVLVSVLRVNFPGVIIAALLSLEVAALAAVLPLRPALAYRRD